MSDFADTSVSVFLIDCWLKGNIDPEEHKILLQILELYISLSMSHKLPQILHQVKNYLAVILDYEYERCLNANSNS